LNAQNWKSKVFGGKNQFEFGISNVSYPNSKFDDNFNFYKDYLKPGYSTMRRHNYYFGYNRIINSKYFIGVNLTSSFTPNGKDFSAIAIGEILRSYNEQLNFNLGHLFSYRNINIIPTIQLSYRYGGSQSAIFGFRDPIGILTEPLFAYLEYNSLGGSIGGDINYFFSKHVGLGVKTSYNYYPFENAKLSAGESIDQPDPLLVETHKPLNQMLIVNIKIITKF
jgi:hypothetical protein